MQKVRLDYANYAFRIFGPRSPVIEDSEARYTNAAGVTATSVTNATYPVDILTTALIGDGDGYGLSLDNSYGRIRSSYITHTAYGIYDYTQTFGTAFTLSAVNNTIVHTTYGLYYAVYASSGYNLSVNAWNNVFAVNASYAVYDGSGNVLAANITEGARALGFRVPDGVSSAAAVQEITKQVAARAAQAGSDVARGMMQDGSIEAIKNPEANKQILAQLYADLDEAQSRYETIDKNIRDTPTGDISKMTQEWRTANPANKFQDDAYNRLGVIGATPLDDSGTPDPTRMKVGALYVLKPEEYWRAMKGTVARDSIRGNVRVKVAEQNGQKGLVVQ